MGDGSAPLTTGGAHVTDTLTVTHTYATVGVYTVTLTVTDTTGLSATDHLRVTVTPDCIQVGEMLTFTGGYTDPGWLDTHTVTWTFGDGSTALNPLTVTHAYTAPGIYEVRLTVHDDDGGVSYDAVTVTVGCPAYVTLHPGVLGDAADATLWAGDPYATGDGMRLYTGYAEGYDPAGRAGGRLFRPVANLAGSGPMRTLLWFDLADAGLPSSAAVVSATTEYTVYPSSEATTVAQRPWLQVCYLD